MTTHRPLPLEDPTIDALAPAARIAIGGLWCRRAESELRVGAQFALLSQGFSERPASDEVRALLAQAAFDEARHSELCAAMGERYTGERRDLPPSPLSPSSASAVPTRQCRCSSTSSCSRA